MAKKAKSSRPKQSKPNSHSECRMELPGPPKLAHPKKPLPFWQGAGALRAPAPLFSSFLSEQKVRAKSLPNENAAGAPCKCFRNISASRAGFDKVAHLALARHQASAVSLLSSCVAARAWSASSLASLTTAPCDYRSLLDCLRQVPPRLEPGSLGRLPSCLL
jgi:hypothetical protein